MKKTLSRSLSLLLAIVLAVSLALPAAATFPITLDQSKATIAPKDSITLTATLSSEYANKSVTWESSDKTVAEVNENKDINKDQQQISLDLDDDLEDDEFFDDFFDN